MISANAIDISNLPSELLEVLGPLFCELEDLSQALDMEEFVDALGRLYDTLSKPDKEKLLLRNDRKRRVNQEPDFKVRNPSLTLYSPRSTRNQRSWLPVGTRQKPTSQLVCTPSEE